MLPVMTISSPTASAFVVRSVRAVPAFGSDIATATIISPAQTCGTIRCFSSSGAKCTTARRGPKLDSNTGNASGDEILAISSITMTASRWPSPCPPSSVGRFTPRYPMSANFFITPGPGDSPDFSTSTAISGNSLVANLRTLSCNARWSSLSEKSIPVFLLTLRKLCAP